MPKQTKLKKQGIKNSKLKTKLGHKCVYCKCENKLLLTIDHITPTVRGGEDVDKNKQIACLPCNWLKGGLTHEEFVIYFNSLMDLKDLNKIKFVMKDINLYFSPYGFPSDMEEKKEVVTGELPTIIKKEKKV